MPTPTLDSMLELWSRGAGASRFEQRRALLQASRNDDDALTSPLRTIGQGDRQLLEFRDILFGSRFVALSGCPQCRETVELTFDTKDLLSEPASPAVEPVQTFELAGVCVRFRLPGEPDLEAIGSAPNTEGARSRLLERCVLWASWQGSEIGAGSLPAAVVSALCERMAECDPQANLELMAACPACGEKWEIAFDIAAYLWEELSAWAMGLVRDIHTLACAYGWTEREILALSPTRRRIYLALIAG